MTQEQFIKEVVKYVQKYAPQYGIKVYSPIISQAILESASGTSELAVNAHNYFGLKYRPNRCPTACGIYYKIGSEQNTDGTYTSSAMQWMKFSSMEAGIQGYFDFINISNYSNLKGVTDPETYLKNIKADGYATSLSYISKCMNVIKKYNLTQYDTINNTTTTNKGGTSMATPIIALSAGHGLYTAGKRCLKTLDPAETREWVLNDRIADKVETKLTAYYCEVIRVNDTYGKKDTALTTRVNTANKAKADVYISVHHNAGLNGRSGGGTQVYYYSSNAARANEAKALYDAIVKETKYNGNRSQKVVKQNLYECRKTNMPAFLVEAAFMDSSTDVPLLLTETFAENVAVGIVNFLVDYLNLRSNGKVVNTAKPESKSVENTSVPNSSYSKTQFIKEVQAAIGARVDGIAGAETLSKTVTISKTKNRKHAVVKPVQKYLNYLGYNCGIPDCVAGTKFDTAVKSFQKANGCKKDGELTQKGLTWTKILGLK